MGVKVGDVALQGKEEWDMQGARGSMLWEEAGCHIARLSGSEGDTEIQGVSWGGQRVAGLQAQAPWDNVSSEG